MCECVKWLFWKTSVEKVFYFSVSTFLHCFWPLTSFFFSKLWLCNYQGLENLQMLKRTVEWISHLKCLSVPWGFQLENWFIRKYPFHKSTLKKRNKRQPINYHNLVKAGGMLGVTGIIHLLGLLLELTAEKSPETNKSQHSLPFQMSQSLYSSHLKRKDCWFWGNRARTSNPVSFFDNIFIAFSNWQSHPCQHVLNHRGTRSPVA